ncbi:helix-turn-helix domain-containing protein [Tropicibacter oceani]|uniref:AraC family transcriptional regulator n=1 Tax=Tropicibacter oceani TaxID=3058420 RepID=A0ABY8QJU5_9RHOB|nr:AraC family transcriptional regulator [Tropicibacter oceani]WGW04889.1 AraC family transcriptional regulator [Tropicibacter oceani]
MPTFPVPLFAAVLLAIVALHLALRSERAGWLAALVGACAAQALVLSLVQHYGFAQFRLLQAVTATVIPPLAWIAFTAGALRPVTRRDARHFGAPLLALACALLLPDLLDALIPLTYLGYGLAIGHRALAGGDAMPRTRLETGELSARFWITIAGALLVSALSEVAILGAIITGNADLRPWIVSFVTSATNLVVGWVCLSPGLAPPEATDDTPEAPEVTEEDSRITARLDKLLDDTALYLDPDLTLDRLARRLSLPRKTLSAALNRVSGENVSRYINARRIRAACDRLTAGERVTEAWLSSGFNTKSNFNREFLRVTGQTPSAWAAAHKKENPEETPGLR